MACRESERAARIAHALEFMDLSHVAGKLVKHYSGGMIRKLEIAQSMLHRPRILFLDEPTVGLDPIAKQSVWQNIRDLREEFGTTILMTTHDMQEADELCETVAFMHAGELAALGSPAALKSALGASASLGDVFIHYTGATISDGGDFRDAARYTKHHTGVSAEAFPGAEFARQTMAVAEADIRKLIHDPVELFTRMVQPALWLLIFGEVFTRVRAIPTGGIPYIDFMTPGILAQNVLFGAIFYGISLIWERDLGIVHKYLVSPASRERLWCWAAPFPPLRAPCARWFWCMCWPSCSAFTCASIRCRWPG